jgi:prevent-host-death family protein
MITMNINEAKAHLSDALKSVAKGETVVLCKRNKPVAEIRAIKEIPKKKRPIGLAAKEHPDFVIDTRFFDPLPNELLDAFSQGGE